MGEQFNKVIAIIIWFLPFFLVPYAFKMAGGAIGAMHAAISARAAKGKEAFLGNPNDSRSLRNRTRYRARSGVNAVRGRAYDSLAGNAKLNPRDSKRTRIARKIAGRAARAVNYGNLQGERALYNKEQADITQAQVNHGDDTNIRALWAEKYDGTGEANGRVAGGYYSPYQDPDGSYKQFSSADVAKAHSLVKSDPSRLQASATYEMGKAPDDEGAATVRQRMVDKMNQFGYTRSEAEGVWAGVKFAHKGARLEQKYTGLTGDKGNLGVGEIKHDQLSRELADGVRSYDFANFRSSTAEAAISGYGHAVTEARTGIKHQRDVDGNLRPVYNNGAAVELSHTERQANAATITNYQEVADGLRSKFAGGGRIAGAEGDPAAAVGGYPAMGTGGSARADNAWREFVNTVPPARPPAPAGGGGTPPPPGGGGGGPTPPGGGPTILVPPRGYTPPPGTLPPHP
jgi:hypothetical protein